MGQAMHQSTCVACSWKVEQNPSRSKQAHYNCVCYNTVCADFAKCISFPFFVIKNLKWLMKGKGHHWNNETWQLLPWTGVIFSPLNTTQRKSPGWWRTWDHRLSRTVEVIGVIILVKLNIQEGVDDYIQVSLEKEGCICLIRH